MKNNTKVNGENILYHYIQKNILDSDEISDFQKKLIEHFIVDLSIWIPINLYKRNPILIPFVIRDPSCRNKNPLTGKHEWGMANENGFIRDDNSLIKGIFKCCPIISSEIKEYHNHYLGNGFVASHIWREINKTDKLASRLPFTNSFIPNLVWLPKQISKLTDRENSYAQKLLQSLSYKIYREANNDTYTNEIWSYLPNPEIDITIENSNLNYFEISDTWIESRLKKLKKEIDNILNTIENKPLTMKKVKCSVYLPTLKENLLNSEKERFKDWLIQSKERINYATQQKI